MTEKTITLHPEHNGQPVAIDVALRYCAATENGYEQIAGKSIAEIDFKSQADLLRLAVAAIVTAYQRKGQDAPVTADELLYDCPPQDIITLLTATIQLRNEWYQVPAVVPQEEGNAEQDEQPKND